VRGIAFDIWDLILCELEDTIYESFSAKRHMNYAHWISFLIYMGVEPMLAASVQEWSTTTFEYPIYDFSQLVRTVTATLVRASHRPVVLEIAAQQDATVQGLAETKLEQLETQGAGAAQVELDSDPIDSSDDDYQPLPTYCSSRPHDREASGLGSATDPALVSILSRLTKNQERAERHHQQDRQETTAALAQVQARQDEFQRQVLEL
jgi:hypothetical protein